MSTMQSQVESLLLIATRLSALILYSPIQAISQLPKLARMVLLLSISFIFLNYLRPAPALQSLTIAALAEFSNSMIIALFVSVCFSTLKMAGQIIDRQIGLDGISVFNPQEHNLEGLNSRLLSMLGLLFFFNFGGHLLLFRELAQLFSIIPLGSLMPLSGIKPVIHLFSMLFSYAIGIASPIILSMSLIDWGSTLVCRSMPQISPYFLSIPIKIILGLLIVHVLIYYLLPLTTALFSRIFLAFQELRS